MSKITSNNDPLRSFIQVRQKIQKYKAGTPYYEPLHTLKRNQLIGKTALFRHVVQKGYYTPIDTTT